MNTPDPTIGIALPYFGPFPEYAPLFFWTFGFNDSVDLYLFTDQTYDGYVPDNVHIVPMSISEFRHLAEGKIGMSISLQYGYKVCDLKPMYGVILDEWLREYDFWGFCDMDVVWGDIRAFASAEWLSDADLATFRGKSFLSGAFQLYRNVPRVNSLYQMSPNVDQVVASDNVRNFTEAGYRWTAPPRTIEEIAGAGEIVSMTDIAREASENGAIRLKKPNWVTEPSIRFRKHKYFGIDYKWERGTLTRMSDAHDMIYCHMVYMKRENIFDFDMKRDRPDMFYIRPFGIEYIDSDQKVLRVASGAYSALKNGRYISSRLVNRLTA